MRRLGSAFVTLWILIFVPFLIIWGLMVRWSEAASTRFESIWRWSADHLAFPLIFSPLTDWSWLALEKGTPLQAVVGFVVLVAVWALMLSLPLVLIGGWWATVMGRTSGPAANAIASPGPVIIRGQNPALDSPSGALYLITLPVALLLVGLRHLWSLRSSWLGTLLMVGAVVFVLVVCLLALIFGKTSYWDRIESLRFIYSTMWLGYLDTLFVPRLFGDRWMAAADVITFNANTLQYEDWASYMGHWYRHDEFRTLVWLTALRHALLAMMVYGVIKLIRRVLR